MHQKILRESLSDKAKQLMALALVAQESDLNGMDSELITSIFEVLFSTAVELGEDINKLTDTDDKAEMLKLSNQLKALSLIAQDGDVGGLSPDETIQYLALVVSAVMGILELNQNHHLITEVA